MTIDPDVRGIAKQWGLDAALVQAVVNAEGGGAAIIRAVQCSIPAIQTRAQALQVLCRSITHAMSDLVRAKYAGEFVEQFGAKWAPVGVANDPTNLNTNWSGNVKKLWGVVVVIVCLLSATTAFAQADVVGSVKAALQARGVDLSGPCGAFQITKRVAWQLRGNGAGTLDKPSGNNCEGRAVDIIVFNDGHGYDILSDGGGANGPAWNDVPIENGAGRWRPVTADPDGGGPPVVNNPPPNVPPIINIPPAQILDLSSVLGAIKDVRDAQERIYADETNQRKDQTAAIVASVNNPGWFSQVFGNRFVQLAIAGVATYYTTHQMTKP